MEQEELVFSVSSEEVDELIETTPPDQLVEKVAELIDWGKRAIHNANLEEKLTEQQIFQLLSMKNVRDVPVLHRLIQENPTSTVELLKQITDEDQFSQLIFMKDDGCQENDDQSNSLSLAVFWERSDVVRCICTRLNKDNLYKLLCDPDENGNTALHYALWRDYSLDKLLEPFTAAESHKLLSIENNAGEIAGVSGWEVDELIETTPPDQLIKKLANLIGGDAIHNANLEEKLTEQQIFQLLSMRRFGDDPVLHRLIENNPASSTVKLLKQITDADQFKQLIFMKDDKYQYNSLSWAVFWNRSDVVRCIYTRLNKDNLYKLLHVQGMHGNTALHYASGEDYPLDELLGPFTATESHKLLSIRNKKGQTVLSHFIETGKLEPFQSFIKLHSDRKSKLLDLAMIPDYEGNTSFHYAAGRDTSRYLTGLIQTTLTFKIRRRFSNALEKKNASNEIFKSPRSSWVKPHPANAIIYQWALESTRNRQYLLFHYPKVLIISIEANREGAEEEAGVLIDCFQSHGFKVDAKPNRKKQDMLDDLKEASKSKTGLIVAIMSHGGEGYILDNEGERIDIKEIEENMTHHDHTTPKCLILQCCQYSEARQPNVTNRNPSEHVEPQTETNGTENPAAAAGTATEITPVPEQTFVSPEEDVGPSYEAVSPYIPRSRHLCVFMSTIPGQLALRNQFIPAFVEAIEQLEPDQSISEAFTVAADELNLNVESQIPIFYNLMPQKFCIKNVLPLVLKRAGVSDEAVGGVAGADVNEQSGAQTGAVGEAVGGTVGEAVGGAVGRAVGGTVGGAVGGAQ